MLSASSAESDRGRGVERRVAGSRAVRAGRARGRRAHHGRLDDEPSVALHALADPHARVRVPDDEALEQQQRLTDGAGVERAQTAGALATPVAVRRVRASFVAAGAMTSTVLARRRILAGTRMEARIGGQLLQ